jgi:hypothetical protein
VAIVGAFVLNWAPAAQAVTLTGLGVKGFSNGNVIHAGALNSGNTTVVEGEVAWAGAAADDAKLGLGPVKLNEFARPFQPALTKNSYARASGVEAGLGTNPTVANQIRLTNLAEAAAAPSSKSVKTTTINADPVAFADAASGTSVANWNSSGLVPGVCVIGDDISRGVGFAANAQLLNAATGTNSNGMTAPVVATFANDSNPRAVSQTTSRERLVPVKGHPDTFGLMSEVRQTIAPVTLLANNAAGATAPRLITIEFLGEWVLRVIANGFKGGATVFYGPGNASPQSDILRIINGNGTVSNILKFQDLFGKTGLVIPASPLLKITLGEDPRAISKPNVSPDPASKPTEAANGTLASAAVDVARIELLTGNPATVDLRVGHMEASAQVPAGGIHCPIPVTKDVNPNKIHIQSSPDTARVTFNVLNPYDCDLTDVVLTDAIRQKVGDPDFKLITANPAAESPTMPTGALRTADVVWKLGTIPSGGKKVVTMDVKSAVHGGVLRDVGTASGVLKNCKGGADAGLAVAGLDISNLTLTGVSPVAEIAIELARTGPDTRRTTAVGAGIAALGVGAAFTLRRRRRV